MKEFFDSLKAGKFAVPVCTSCRRTCWPPSTLCPGCLSETALEEADTSGQLVDLTESRVKGKEGTFGLIDMNGLKIVGSITGPEPSVGMRMRMRSCGVARDGSPFYEFEAVQS